MFQTFFLLLFSSFFIRNTIGAEFSGITIALKQQNTDILLEALQNVSDVHSEQYGQYWTKEQVNDLVTPDWAPDMIKSMQTFGTHCSLMGASLFCDGLMGLWPWADRVDFVEMMVHNPTEQGKTSVEWNNGRTSHRVGVNDGYVGREVMNRLYNITYNKVQKGSSACSVEYQGASGFSPSDLATAQKLNGEPLNPVLHVVGSNDPSNPMLEAQLDVQMMSQVAENVDLWYWENNQWLYSFATQFLNRTVIPKVLSMSWGWAEKQQCSIGTCYNLTSAQYIARVNLEYAKMGLRGVSVCISSGDAGAPGRTNEGCDDGSGVNPVFPGSSPYVTSVSATYLTGPESSKQWISPLCQQYGCAKGSKELPTNFNVTGWTTGGGFGIYAEKRPTWQAKAVEAYLKSGVKLPSNFSRNGRGYPDVSALGHYCPVVSGGDVMGVDGTSCSSPVFAGIVALLNDFQQGRGKPVLGFANPVLYKMWEDDPTIFNDIVEGNNWCTEMQCCKEGLNGYPATNGWDPVTGLGTPNVGRMIEWLERNT